MEESVLIPRRLYEAVFASDDKEVEDNKND